MVQSKSQACHHDLFIPVCWQFYLPFEPYSTRTHSLLSRTDLGLQREKHGGVDAHGGNRGFGRSGHLLVFSSVPGSISSWTPKAAAVCSKIVVSCLRKPNSESSKSRAPHWRQTGAWAICGRRQSSRNSSNTSRTGNRWWRFLTMGRRSAASNCHHRLVWRLASSLWHRKQWWPLGVSGIWQATRMRWWSMTWMKCGPVDGRGMKLQPMGRGQRKGRYRRQLYWRRRKSISRKTISCLTFGERRASPLSGVEVAHPPSLRLRLLERVQSLFDSPALISQSRLPTRTSCLPIAWRSSRRLGKCFLQAQQIITFFEDEQASFWRHRQVDSVRARKYSEPHVG